jgi:pimeloyl-ACP methyl ester carboxylesterase
MRIPYSNGSIRYRVTGHGPVIVFLHGFMESARIWRPYAFRLAERFKVIRINLPGHGGSSVYAETHSMEFMADAVKAVLNREGVDQAMLVGHSMGGYVALAFAETYPLQVKALVLFSSTSFSDPAERKEERNRALRAAQAHKLKFITSVVPNLFYERKGSKAGKRIYKMVRIAARQPVEGIMAAIAGMRDRADKTTVLQNATFPIMFLSGHDDFLIPVERIEEMAAKVPKARVEIVEECGHMGFLEQEKVCFDLIEEFALQKII